MKLNTNNIISSLCIIVGGICLSACQESIGERLERETQEYTRKNCPQKFDAEGSIILDSLVFHNDGKNEYVYHYSLQHELAMPETFSQMRDELKTSLLNGIKNSAELRHIKDEGMTLKYVYYDASTHKVVASFRFTKEDYE